MIFPRRTSTSLNIGDVKIGDKAPIAVQSMTNTDTADAEKTLKQIFQLKNAGCEIVRIAVPDAKAIDAVKIICQKSPLPLIADIHFDYRLAIASLEAGINALRINPGNIGNSEKIDRVIDAAKAHKAPIRIGVNAGSLEKDLLKKYGSPTAEALCESAMRHIRILEKRTFDKIKISLKASSVPLTLASYRLLAEQCSYPFHIGITEAGTLKQGTIKSSVGIGILLSEGLGDTLRVSLTQDPVKEMPVAWGILSAMGLRQRGPELISCPTCGRTEIDLISLAEDVEKELENITEYFTVAVMGCVVNGPGEAREADIGIAGGRGKGIIFRKGKSIRSISGSKSDLLSAFMQEINILRDEMREKQKS